MTPSGAPVDLSAALDRYAAFWQEVRPETVENVRELVRPDVLFRDPFNEIVGSDALVGLLKGMFVALREPAFVVTDRAVGAAAGYLRWQMTFRLGRAPGSRPWAIDGMTEARFDPAGLLVAHIDHWDAAGYVYQHVPVLGTILRVMRRRLAHH